ncbi:MAG: hypothetical protein P4L86_22725 [Mycobacterium sp.]|nr:hypothetical protein [Mycobacterium sp.]
MKTYARVENRIIAEIITTAGNIGSLFHPSLHWVDVTGQAVQVGWVQGDNGTFAPPPPPPIAATLPPPNFAELLAELTALKAQVAQLHIS